MKCKNCDGTGKVKGYAKKDNFKERIVECNWCDGTGIQRKYL